MDILKSPFTKDNKMDMKSWKKKYCNDLRMSLNKDRYLAQRYLNKAKEAHRMDNKFLRSSYYRSYQRVMRGIKDSELHLAKMEKK